ncbi:ubiquitin binding protein [Athelia psychrophila]|uniref:Vacuolar protein sorting-associated protein 27 n=1 Tax=Athelia psychrophila TaxID=1759441 RepID=A0A166T7I3_9AGAM|nr:ubiquitin binding protein [Fibularhizoctonia sp. CBS 109695]
MSLTTWLWGTSQLDEAVDKATSELLPSGTEDLALNLEICDQIRSKSVSSKEAMHALKRRLNHKNPNVQLLALGLTDGCIKNGGDPFLAEVASREFIDNLVSIMKIPSVNNNVKTEALRLIQNWATVFEGKPSLGYVGQVYKNLKGEGFVFPPKDLAAASSAMVDTQTAPEWIDSDVCLRCRTAFSFTNRKHHCRNCGQVFDQQCSSKIMPLPHFGITQDVRVCDGCHAKLTKKAEKDKGDNHKAHRHSTSLHGARHRSARELADAELQRAIQLSLQEVGAASGHKRPGFVLPQTYPTPWQTSEPPLIDHKSRPDRRQEAAEEDDPDLRAAIEASLQEANAPRPSAPVALETPRSENAPFSYSDAGYSQSYPPTVTPTPAVPSVPQLPNYDLEPLESDTILTFSQTVEQVEAQGGRDMARYPAVNELFDKANGLRPKLAMSLDDTGRKEQMLSEMHDKLSQAVKLYDNLLTQQVAHPPWTRSPPPTQSPYQPIQQQQAYNPYQPAYGQWAPTPPQPLAQAPPMSPGGYQQYAEQSRQTHSSPISHYRSDAPAQPYAPEPSRTPLAPIVQSPQQQQHSQPPWQSQQQPQFVQTHTAPVSAPPPPPTQYSHPPPQSAYTPAGSAPYQPNGSQSPAPVPAPQHHTFSTQAPVQRHNTTASYAPPAPQQHHASNPVRHNTAAAAAPPTPVYQQQQQQQQPTISQFPIAPTSAPQLYSMYGPSIPTTSPQPEREALLIDL